MRLATIDIGTNTILLLIVDVTRGGALTTVLDEQVIARLGKGIDAERRIAADTSERVVGYLQKYKSTAESHGCEKIIACGTSALRDASNGDEFVGFVREKTGLELSILSGAEEAELTYRGAVSEFLQERVRQRFAVLDIGGGSTEFTVGDGESVLRKISHDVGCVRLTERILHSSPPTSSALAQGFDEIRAWLSTFPRLLPETQLIGVAGTVTTLAAIDLNLETSDPKRVGGHFLHSDFINRVFTKLRSLTVQEMVEKYPQIQVGRADIILAGIMILVEALRHLGAPGITASDRGLRYGIALREISKEADKH